MKHHIKYYCFIVGRYIFKNAILITVCETHMVNISCKNTVI